jgi:hypothetical protein
MSASTTESVTIAEQPAASLVGQLAWNFRHHPKRELWFAWWVMVVFYQLYGLLFFVIARVQPPPSPGWDTATVVQWFSDHHLGILAGFGVVFLITGMTAPINALIAYSMRRMSVSPALVAQTSPSLTFAASLLRYVAYACSTGVRDYLCIGHGRVRRSELEAVQSAKGSPSGRAHLVLGFLCERRTAPSGGRGVEAVQRIKSADLRVRFG